LSSYLRVGLSIYLFLSGFPIHLHLINLIILMQFGKEYKFWSSCCFLLWVLNILHIGTFARIMTQFN
jgi:hypothetical protein